MNPSDRLYNLLPAIYRQRDAEQGEALRALLGVMDSEVLLPLEADIAGLYDDAFIETAAEWAVPYIGDLLGVRGLNAASGEAFSLRAYVANTLAYRRRKGTATMLEQLARDVTGWEARVVEFFELLATTQYLNHLRPHNHRTPDLRRVDALENLDTPFDTIAHTADVRHISVAPRPAVNIPNIGIFMWRLQAYTVEKSDARSAAAPGTYTFNPLGQDQPLFNPPRSEERLDHLAEEINVPAALRRRPPFNELEGLRAALAVGKPFSPLYFDADRPVLQIFVDGSLIAIPAEQILICDLTDWPIPPASQSYSQADGTLLAMPLAVAVDPALGRLAFPTGVTPMRVQVSYAYGFSGDVGSGPYNRSRSVSEALLGPITWQVGVSKNIPSVPNQIFDNLTAAVAAWNAQPVGTVGVIAVMDSSSYTENLTGPNAISIPAGSQLLIVAADWPAIEDPPGSSVFVRTVSELTAAEVRPHLRGNLSVRGTAPANSPNPGGLALNGLLIEGRLTVLAGNLGSLRLDHTTLTPGANSLNVNASINPVNRNDRLEIALNRVVCGQVDLHANVPTFSAHDSILDRVGSGLVLTAPGAAVSLHACTLFGRTTVRSLEASNCIFNNEVDVERRQVGCVRYSFVPDGSETPRRYRCQPDLALAQRAEELGLDSASDLTTAERARITRRVQPVFRSNHYHDPAYAQLSRSSDPGILTGSEDGAEMGVWEHLKQPQREANLRSSLDEYLRLGLEAGLFFVT